jgi:hypothetical protein
MKKIFISYSHKDEEWKDRVSAHLSVVPDIEAWDDRRIGGGQEWFPEIEKALNAADIAILLISVDFLNSKFIRSEEIPRVLKRRKAEGLIIFPIIVYDCAWKRIDWLNRINVRPRDGEPLARGDRAVQETRLTAIAHEVFDILDRKKPVPEHSEKIPARCFFHIQKNDQGLAGSVHHGDPGASRPLPALRLDNHAVVSIKNKPHKLGQILASLIHATPGGLNPFDKPFQLDVGQYLFDQLFSEYGRDQIGDNVEVHISTTAGSILALPWQVLSNNRMFLSSQGWTVSLSGHWDLKPCHMPDSPRVLVAAPQPEGKARTEAESHMETLGDRLSDRNHTLTFGQNMEWAYTWEEFTQKLETFSPHVVYFYGHCANNPEKTTLCLASGPRRHPCDITPNELLAAIEKMAEKPLLVYLNCLNNPAGLINFGMTLGKMVPAVITSRYLFSTAAAQAQGLNLLLDIVTGGLPPHKAAASLFRRLDESLNISTAQARWMTPAVFRHYSEWGAKVPETPSRRIHDPHWHLKVDRVAQSSVVNNLTMQMMRERKPRSLAFVWYGTQGQGVSKFHHRLTVELQEFLLNFNTSFYDVHPEWPEELNDPGIAFRDRLIEAFQVRHIEDIPGAIRNKNLGASGKQSLVYVRHQPVTSSRVINPHSLHRYLKWWDETFIPLLDRNQFALLGVSFIVNNPPKFRNQFLKEGIEELDMKHTVFRLLDEMEHLARRDLLDFIKTHNLRIPVKNRDKNIERILEKTQGHYEKTILELQRFVEQSWDMAEDEAETVKKVYDDYDY